MSTYRDALAAMKLGQLPDMMELVEIAARVEELEAQAISNMITIENHDCALSSMDACLEKEKQAHLATQRALDWCSQELKRRTVRSPSFFPAQFAETIAVACEAVKVAPKVEQLGPWGCRCRSLAHRMVGDGCDICNPKGTQS